MGKYVNAFHDVIFLRRFYKNWFALSYQLLRYNGAVRQVKATLRGGYEMQIDRYSTLLLAKLLSNGQATLDEDFAGTGLIIIDCMGQKLKIKIVENNNYNGAVYGVFADHEYNFLSPFEGSTVIDVGANIGDSALYFICSGADNVIALEPYPFSYKMAGYNLQSNNVNERVMLLNSGYGHNEVVNVTKSQANGSKPLKNNGDSTSESMEVPTYSLKELLSLSNGDGTLLLKMDCEGCEYNLMHEDSEVLSRFSRIIIEYHYGPQHIPEKLEEAGFEVTFSKPVSIYNPDMPDPKTRQGMIYASK